MALKELPSRGSVALPLPLFMATTWIYSSRSITQSRRLRISTLTAASVAAPTQLWLATRSLVARGREALTGVEKTETQPVIGQIVGDGSYSGGYGAGCRKNNWPTPVA